MKRTRPSSAYSSVAIRSHPFFHGGEEAAQTDRHRTEIGDLVDLDLGVELAFFFQDGLDLVACDRVKTAAEAHELDEVAESVTALREAGAAELVLLQCVAAYPTPISEINVGVIETLREEFGVPTGLSDHTLDPVTAPSAAVALGACVIEKHFTLDKSMEGPDHEFALEPDELDRMVTAIRDTEAALGSGEKHVLEVERELHEKARRAIHAVEDIEAGGELTEENLKVLRPGGRTPGLDPQFYDEIVGTTADQDVRKGDGIEWEDIANYDS